MQTWKIGELARRTGMTVRSLHHYDEIGLLTPSGRTGSGHRLYTADDVTRLQMIVSLRQLGLPLKEIGDWLARPGTTAQSVLDLHLARLREQIDARQTLYRRLEAVAERLRTAETVSAEDFLNLMERIAMYDKHYTEEQREQLAERARQLGPDAIRAAEAEWPELIAKVRAEMDKGTDPAHATVQALARRWQELVQSFTGGDPGITQSLKTMYQQEPAAREKSGLDPAIFAYVNRALSAKEGV